MSVWPLWCSSVLVRPCFELVLGCICLLMLAHSESVVAVPAKQTRPTDDDSPRSPGVMTAPAHTGKLSGTGPVREDDDFADADLDDLLAE